MTELLRVHLDTSAVTTIANDAIVTLPHKEQEHIIEESGSWGRIKARIYLDLNALKARYRLGALEAGPVTITVYIHYLDLRVDWHNALGIPRSACIKLWDACGRKVEVCWKWDWGVTDIALMRNTPFPPTSLYLPLLDLNFRSETNAEGDDGYKLYGRFSFVAIIIQALTFGIVEGISRTLSGAVRRFLEHVLGSGDIARIFIELIMGAWNIVNVVLGFFSRVVTVLLQPLDELLHQLFGNALEVNMGVFMPKAFELMEAKDQHAAVIYDLSRAPEIELIQSGAQLKLLE